VRSPRRSRRLTSITLLASVLCLRRAADVVYNVRGRAEGMSSSLGECLIVCRCARFWLQQSGPLVFLLFFFFF